jgi:hypothetical protein
MTDAASLVYEPLNEYKPLWLDIGIVDGPLEYFRTVGVRLPLPFSTRMTVVRLKNGDLFLHSPIAFEACLAGQLQSMGRIRHLVSPNQFHYAHIGEWSRAFPDAVTWASPGARARARARGIHVDFKRELGDDAPDEWRDEIEQTAVPGGIFGEIVFFHKLSNTLILADTILNLELEKLRQPWRFARGSQGCTTRGASYFSECDYRSSCRGEKREQQPRRCFHGNPNVSSLATDTALKRMARRYCDASSPGRCRRASTAEGWLSGLTHRS